MMKEKRTKRGVFHWIAPVYGLFYQYQKRMFQSAFVATKREIDLMAFDTILDVGCGTGALCSVLNEAGFTVTCAEPVERMLAIGRKRKENQKIHFVLADALEGLPFDDKSFDLVFCSFVAHGMKAPERMRLYKELERVARHLVILQDYNRNRSILTDVIERLEGGDYFNFIHNVDNELAAVFHSVKALDVGPRSAWYLCKP